MMNSYKKHIALLLLLGFLFPQAANSAHHFLVLHETITKAANAFEYNNHKAYEYHFCDYHISAIKFLLPEIGYAEKITVPENVLNRTYYYLPNYFGEIELNCPVRGPPFAITYSKPDIKY